MAMERLGSDEVHKYVGREPSGKSYNDVSLNQSGQPHNPLINSGAIMICSLLGNLKDESKRFSENLQFWERLQGGKKVTYSNTVFLSEKSNADLNMAIAYLMKSRGAFKDSNVNILSILEFYFQCCSIESNTDKLSIVAATLANGGVCPLTSERIFKTETV